MPNYCIYLRKSRSDVEAEARGDGETLVRHERALIEIAKKMLLKNKNIEEIIDFTDLTKEEIEKLR